MILLLCDKIVLW